MHAVNLRNLLGAKRTQRHEQGDESPEFLALFPTPPVYINGSRTPSGFFTVDDPVNLFVFFLILFCIKV